MTANSEARKRQAAAAALIVARQERRREVMQQAAERVWAGADMTDADCLLAALDDLGWVVTER